MMVFHSKRQDADDPHARDRAIMVAHHLEARGITDPLVLAAMGEVPREAFVSASLKEFAYEDSALPIEAGQTISQPYIVARMIELLELAPGDKVLEVGAGSGYAAAVMSRIASKVYAIERHKDLADLARARLKALGYSNIEIIYADGTKGLAEQVPFEAILVSAGGPRVPEALKQQLAIGGRLVIPVGRDIHQTLLLVRRIDKDTFEQEDYGAVTFVPLIGAEGWAEREQPEATSIDAETSGFADGLLVPSQRARVIRSKISSLIAEAAEPFGDLNDLARLAERFAHKRVALLGEATHGTAEFYDARAAITEMLVAKHGFNIVAVEADWPDAAVYDAYVRGLPRPKVPKRAFTRFPTWMWRNNQVAAFLDNLQAINKRIGDPEQRCGFYGLDVYSLSASIEAVLLYLDTVDPEAARVARQRYGCLTPWRAEPVRYGRMALSRGYGVCEKPVTDALIDLLRKRLNYLQRDGDEAFFDAEQNARIVSAAEEYYRVMYYGDAASWNLRDQHMFDTLERLLTHRGPDAKAVVWAHNSHIGNAEFTEMGQVRGEHNIGQLCRARFGDGAALIGFGTDSGTVAAASDWHGPMEIKRVRPARDDSYEGRSRETNIPAFFLETGPGQKERVRLDLAEPLLERAIGVIYRPETELLSHYFQAELSRQFDAWIWFTETRAVAAQETAAYAAGPEETYPFGL
jgi:protein-L-isoaspartate(D-aspartate) O-methyltransferase